MPVPFLDLAAAYRELKPEIDAAVARVLASGHYILGSEVDCFEHEYAEWCGARHCVGVGNGLDALTLALLALGVEPGDEVIVPSNTYIATWLAVSRCGATPVPVDPPPGQVNLSADAIKSAISGKTRAILLVHLYGIPAEIGPIIALARQHGIFVVEDAAQAHGAALAGQRLGGHGDAVCWSFYPSKNLGALGDGGAVTLNDDATAQRLRLLRNYGSRVKYVHEIKGFNSRLDPMQAAILRVKLKVLADWNERRRAVARRYDACFRSLALGLPFVPEQAEPVWHLYVVWHEQRDGLQRFLAGAGIETLIHYPIPPHRQEAYADQVGRFGNLPEADLQARSALSLPIGPHLSAAQVEEVVASVARFVS